MSEGTCRPCFVFAREPGNAERIVINVFFFRLNLRVTRAIVAPVMTEVRVQKNRPRKRTDCIPDNIDKRTKIRNGSVGKTMIWKKYFIE